MRGSPEVEQLDDQRRRSRAHATIDRLQHALLDHDMQAFADEWAPDGTMSFPFAPPGWPELDGREAVRAYVSDYTQTFDVAAITRQTRHDTADPDTVILEWAVSGRAVKTGNPYEIAYVAVITVDADGISGYRDYWNPLAAGAALGGLDEMMAAFDVAGEK
ncbi:nuclear transport factor 2 family protein [Mycolicibacterium holsaticum]|jgi:ketosteroid isomerase-like protein|uniref:nuclear transport factor 2 family protein n=1 Tax=Mycolicibacterium holsaticum TaxID=152142 RepID=UPI001C7E1CA3|nr:nuclear transport factor 2 family protein [Mycolicibacterium holsaticum]QZA15015.1 nuclear transport factor 2 family protein [Mycolicibacterium holsaticum DSM 44478 = JCM 12374]UNC07548.1 nuclear transport factor 2 family protein [Mycolicibacterium holsaticum DSM 44478 = JCM 12374]